MNEIFDTTEHDYAELRAQDQAEKRRFFANLKHPDCRDPDHPGCEMCEHDDDKSD